MNIITRLGVAAAIGAAALTNAGPAAAVVVTFASFLPADQSLYNLRYEQTAIASGNLYTTSTSSASVPGATATRFSFVNSTLANLGVLNARFSFFASVTDNPALSVGGFIVQNGNNGSFSFTYTGATPLIVGSSVFTTGANLLSGTFTNATGFGTDNGSSGSLFGSTPNGSITYFSDFMTFDPATNKDFSLAMTAITPVLSRLNANSTVASFRANTTGSFSDEVAIVPEPQIWATLVAGLGLVGIKLRRRNRRVSVTA